LTEVGKRASVLVSANATNILFQMIYRESEDQMSSDETMMLAHFVLGKLSQKGSPENHQISLNFKSDISEYVINVIY
jgi:hypothetical protein